MIAGSVKAILGADTRPLNMAINKAKVTVKGLGKQLRSALGQFGIGIGMAGFISSLTRLTSELERTSNNLGISTDFLQAMQYAAQQNELSVDGLSMAMQRFARRSAEAAHGQGELAKVFKEQGIQVKKSNGQMKSTEELLKDFAEAVKNAGTEQEQLRLAFKAFDSEGAQFVALMKDGAAGLEEYKRKAEEVGAVIDQKAIKSINQFTTQVKNAATIAAAFFANILGWVMSVTAELARFMGALSATDDIRKAMAAVRDLQKMDEEVKAMQEGLDLAEDRLKIEEQINDVITKRTKAMNDLQNRMDDDAFRFSMEELQGMTLGPNALRTIQQVRNTRRQIQDMRDRAAQDGGVPTEQNARLRTSADILQSRLDQFLQQNSGSVDLVNSILNSRRVAELERRMEQAARMGRTDIASNLQRERLNIMQSMQSLNTGERNPYERLQESITELSTQVENLQGRLDETIRVRVENAQ